MKTALFETKIIHELEIEFYADEYFLTLATPSDYGLVERLSVNAARDEVSTPLTALTIEWLIDRNPAGRGFLVLARSNRDNAIIGYFLFYPKNLMWRAHISDSATCLPVFLCVHLYVDINYRRRRIFENMTMFGRRILESTGINFLYTVPNPRSTPGFLRIGMTKIGALAFFARPVKAPFSLISAICRTSGSTATNSRVAEFDATTINQISLRPQSSIAQVWGDRRAASLNWRFRDRPDVQYAVHLVEIEDETVGYVVLRRMPIMKYSALVICDFWLEKSPIGALADIVDTALSDEPGNIDIVIGLAGSMDPKLRQEFWRAGLIPIPQLMLPQPVNLIGGKTNSSNDDPSIGDLSDWALTPYDWDVF